MPVRGSVGDQHNIVHASAPSSIGSSVHLARDRNLSQRNRVGNPLQVSQRNVVESGHDVSLLLSSQVSNRCGTSDFAPQESRSNVPQFDIAVAEAIARSYIANVGAQDLECEVAVANS